MAATLAVEKGAEDMSAPKIQLKSTSFDARARIPAQYTCDGRDVSPPLAWKSAGS